jgi:2-iminobutanoate/2-iminopropanoate deaminase
MPLKKVIESPRVPRLGPYSQAVQVGDLIYTAGQAGIDPDSGKVAGDSFAAQARQAFTNLRTLLEAAGSRMDQVVKVTCFVTEAENFGTLNDLFAEFFPEAPPARSVPVVDLPRGLKFSIEAIAVTFPFTPSPSEPQ